MKTSEQLPKLYRTVYVPVYFEQPRVVWGEYDPWMNVYYHKARMALNENGEREWYFVEKPPTEQEIKCYIECEFDEWYDKHPEPIKEVWRSKQMPPIKEQRELENFSLMFSDFPI